MSRLLCQDHIFYLCQHYVANPLHHLVCHLGDLPHEDHGSQRTFPDALHAAEEDTRDKTTEMQTSVISKPIFMLPNFTGATLQMASTIPSPAVVTRFAITSTLMPRGDQHDAEDTKQPLFPIIGDR